MYVAKTALPAWACFAIAIAGLLVLLLVIFVVRRGLRDTVPHPTEIQLPVDTDAVHAGPLPYRNPLDERRRPGILTAVAVISIVVGSLGLVANLFELLSTTGVLFFSTTSSTVVTTTTTGTVVVVGGGGPATAGATTMATTTFASPRPPTRVVILALLNCLLHLGVAAYLLMIGILLLRDSRHGRTQHLAYAWFKLFLVVVAVWSNWAWYNAQFAGLPGGSSTVAVVMMSVLFVVPGAIYPIALLIVMNTRSVRTYYRTWISSKLNETA